MPSVQGKRERPKGGHMASDILQDVKSFLDDLAHELTGLNVKAAAVTNAPDDQDARDALAAVPGVLIERAQGLSGADRAAAAPRRGRGRHAARRERAAAKAKQDAKGRR
jgi:hypothetical protein